MAHKKQIKMSLSVLKRGWADRDIFRFFLLISFCFFPRASKFMLMIAESILEVHHHQTSICQESVFITTIVACAPRAKPKTISCIYMFTKKMKWKFIKYAGTDWQTEADVKTLLKNECSPNSGASSTSRSCLQPQRNMKTHIFTIYIYFENGKIHSTGWG